MHTSTLASCSFTSLPHILLPSTEPTITAPEWTRYIKSKIKCSNMKYLQFQLNITYNSVSGPNSKFCLEANTSWCLTADISAFFSLFDQLLTQKDIIRCLSIILAEPTIFVNDAYFLPISIPLHVFDNTLVAVIYHLFIPGSYKFKEIYYFIVWVCV